MIGYFATGGKQRSELRLRPVLGMIAIVAALATPAKASMIGYYNLVNWTLTNTDNGDFPSFTNGSAVQGADTNTAILTGGQSGSDLPGTTDLVIRSIGTGLVQFRYSYFSLDVPSAFNPGCGPFATAACDMAGYLLNGQFTGLADDVNQLSGSIALAVKAGDIFGFRVATLDNIGEPGILTITDFSAPVPEPATTLLVPVMAALMIAAGRRLRDAQRRERR